MSKNEFSEAAKQIVEKSQGTLSDHLGIEFTELRPECVSASMPVTAHHLQPAGILHGGALLALAETVASVAGRLNSRPGKSIVGMELNANHIRSVKSGTVTATATPIHIGSRTQVWEVRTVNEEQKLISISRTTLAVIDVDL